MKFDHNVSKCQKNTALYSSRQTPRTYVYLLKHDDLSAR